MFDILEKALDDFVDVEKEKIYSTTIPSDKLTILQIRDRITGIGEIVHEDLDNKAYIIMFKSGEPARQKSFSAVGLLDDTIYLCSYSNRLVAKSDLAKKNTELIIARIKKVPQKRKNNIKLWSIILVIGIISSFAVGILLRSHKENPVPNQDTIITSPTKEELIKEYENVNANYTTIAKEYNALASTLNPNKIGSLNPSITYGSSTKDWSTYSEDNINKTIQDEVEKTEALLSDYITLQQICNPSEDIIIKKLQYIEGIGTIKAVSNDNDPNKLLNTENGYTACVYFSINSINQNEVPGKTIIDKGTDAGGCIEVYKSAKDAQDRCNYLAQFDDSLLYSGSHDYIGTVVIRISYKLPNEDQIKVTEMIEKALLTISTNE